jgi:DNA replication protein
MEAFKGFPEGKIHLTPIPGLFFEQLLPGIDHLGELKMTLYIFWRLEQMEGVFRYLRRVDFLQDEEFMQGLDKEPVQAETILDEALVRAVQRNTLLKADLLIEGNSQACYFLNSPKGRAAIRAIQSGHWKSADQPPTGLVQEPPNIFRLYEDHIGPITPLLAEALAEAEDTYPATWIEEAVRIAVEKNKRNWRYVIAILERWQREGRDGQKVKPQDRRDSAETRRRYVEGEFSDFIEH